MWLSLALLRSSDPQPGSKVELTGLSDGCHEALPDSGLPPCSRPHRACSPQLQLQTQPPFPVTQSFPSCPGGSLSSASRPLCSLSQRGPHAVPSGGATRDKVAAPRPSLLSQDKGPSSDVRGQREASRQRSDPAQGASSVRRARLRAGPEAAQARATGTGEADKRAEHTQGTQV